MAKPKIPHTHVDSEDDLDEHSHLCPECGEPHELDVPTALQLIDTILATLLPWEQGQIIAQLAGEHLAGIPNRACRKAIAAEIDRITQQTTRDIDRRMRGERRMDAEAARRGATPELQPDIPHTLN